MKKTFENRWMRIEIFDEIFNDYLEKSRGDTIDARSKILSDGAFYWSKSLACEPRPETINFWRGHHYPCTQRYFFENIVCGIREDFSPPRPIPRGWLIKIIATPPNQVGLRWLDKNELKSVRIDNFDCDGLDGI